MACILVLSTFLVLCVTSSLFLCRMVRANIPIERYFSCSFDIIRWANKCYSMWLPLFIQLAFMYVSMKALTHKIPKIVSRHILWSRLASSQFINRKWHRKIFNSQIQFYTTFFPSFCLLLPHSTRKKSILNVCTRLIFVRFTSYFLFSFTSFYYVSWIPQAKMNVSLISHHPIYVYFFHTTKKIPLGFSFGFCLSDHFRIWIVLSMFYKLPKQKPKAKHKTGNVL